MNATPSILTNAPGTPWPVLSAAANIAGKPVKITADDVAGFEENEVIGENGIQVICWGKYGILNPPGINNAVGNAFIFLFDFIPLAFQLFILLPYFIGAFAYFCFQAFFIPS